MSSSNSSKGLTLSLLLNLLLVIIVAVFFLGKKESTTEVITEYVLVDEGLKDQVTSQARAAVLINDEGQLIPIDGRGNLVEACSVDGQQQGKPCRFSEEGTKIDLSSLESVSIANYEVNPFCFLIRVGNGFYFEVCY